MGSLFLSLVVVWTRQNNRRGSSGLLLPSQILLIPGILGGFSLSIFRSLFKPLCLLAIRAALQDLLRRICISFVAILSSLPSLSEFGGGELETCLFASFKTTSILLVCGMCNSASNRAPKWMPSSPTPPVNW